jgi:hypothetical protein
MKTFFFIIIFFGAGLFAQAQNDTWTVKMNGKTLLIADKADEIKNGKKIKSTEWKKNGKLEITFKDSQITGMRRDVYITDEQENDVWRKDSASSVSIPLSTLRKLSAGKKQLKIYSVISPSNPAVMLRSRIVHLCTLKLP